MSNNDGIFGIRKWKIIVSASWSKYLVKLFLVVKGFMNVGSYEFLPFKSDFLFEFFSDGPKGKIKKTIFFVLVNDNGFYYFHLAFGDWNPENNSIDDLVVTNNLDKLKTLATVAMAVLKFTGKFAHMHIYAQGSTKARTRLYQMSINAYWKEIDPVLEVFGFLNNKWEPFKKNINYEAFLVKRKNIKFNL